MEKHDYPTARQRLGDSEAGLGSAATLTAADADAIRGIRGVQDVAEGSIRIHVKAGDKRWFTRLHGTTNAALIRRAWTMPAGDSFSAREQSRAEQVMVLGSVAAQRVFGDGDPVGRDVRDLESAVPRRRRGRQPRAGWSRRRAGDDQFDAV